MNNEFSKVLVIGIDGMDPVITKELISKELLPNFEYLSKSGSFLNLSTSNPPNSPVAWTSIATGVNPGKHNIFDFIRRNPNNYLPELSLSKQTGSSDYESFVQTDSFWKFTSKANIPTTIIRWPVTFPPEKIDGKMLSGLGVPDIKGFLSGYSYYSETVETDRSQNNILKITKNNNLIETSLFGPKIKGKKGVIDVKESLKIKIIDEESVELVINNKNYSVKKSEWSEWIKAEFKVGLLKKVSGIFKTYLSSVEPFEMYLTTIQINPENPVSEISYPKEYVKELAKDIGFFYTLGMPEETAGYEDKRISKQAFLSQIREVEEEREKMFWREFESFKKQEVGVLAFVFDSSDRVQHFFWNKTSPSKEVIDYYTKKDKLIARVLEQIDDQTLLLIVSDHGFSTFERGVSINTWLVENGFMTLTKELDEEEGPLFQFVDWSKTKAYSLGFNSIYINLKGREGKGIVENKEQIVDEIVSKLETLTDKKTNEKVVNKAYRSKDIYSGNYVDDSPDIIIGFNPGYRMSWQTAIGGFTKEVLNDNLKKWNGDHLIDPKFVPGVLFSNAKFNKSSASQMDVAPTILDSLGIKIPEDIDGISLLK